MKGFVSVLLFLLLTCCYSTKSYAILASAPAKEVAETQHARIEHRMQQIKAKLERKLFKKYKKAAPPQLWEDDRFRLGVIALAAGLVLALIGRLGILSGFFGFLAILAVIAGLGLVIWALVDY